MAKFIRLHNAENNTVVIVNVEHISLIDTDEFSTKNGTRIVSTISMSAGSDIDDFSVNESPEKIYEMITEN